MFDDYVVATAAGNDDDDDDDARPGTAVVRDVR